MKQITTSKLFANLESMANFMLFASKSNSTKLPIIRLNKLSNFHEN